MNTTEIQEILARDPATHGVQVCALNQLPKVIKQRPQLFIVNTQESHRPGKHWLTLYFPRVGPVECFDSLGRGPRYYHWRLERYLKKHGGYLVYNRKRYQQAGTKTCGQFCLYYAYHRCTGHSIQDIQGDLNSEDLDWNETVVTDFVKDWKIKEDMNDLSLD